MGRRLRVRVPATTANLGSGFDCVGMAFDWYDELELELGADGLEVEVTGEGAADVPRDERHLVVDSILRGLAALGTPRQGMRLAITARSGAPFFLMPAAIPAASKPVTAQSLAAVWDDRADMRQIGS